MDMHGGLGFGRQGQPDHKGCDNCGSERLSIQGETPLKFVEEQRAHWQKVPSTGLRHPKFTKEESPCIGFAADRSYVVGGTAGLGTAHLLGCL